jgi:hypothetical protein
MTRYAVNPPPIDLFVGPLHQMLASNVTAYPVASRCHYQAFGVNRPITVSKVRFYVSVQSGNMSVAICDAAFNLLATTGAFVVPASGERTQVLTGSLALVPGTRYHSAISCDNVTAAFLGAASAVAMGGSAVPRTVVALAAAHPVPASASPALDSARAFYLSFET